jgi:hypothetical protein
VQHHPSPCFASTTCILPVPLVVAPAPQPPPDPQLILPRQNGAEGIMAIPGAEDTIDPATFEQILEMDEDEVDREFSKSIVFDFFGQADSTFGKMDSSL